MSTLLRRIGNKSKLAKEIIPLFPEHRVYVEMFFGAGGMFFNKPKAQYNFLNDLNKDIYNLYYVVSYHSKKLKHLLNEMPEDETLFKHWSINKEGSRVKQALRFLYLSNWSLMSSGKTFSLGVNNTKTITLSRIDITRELLKGTKIFNCDFRDVIKKLSFSKERNKKNIFIYADPPYLGTSNPYKTGSWKENDTEDLFRILSESPYLFAISEFDNPKIISYAEKYKLNVNKIKERQTLKNRNTEILITNYDASNLDYYKKLKFTTK